MTRGKGKPPSQRQLRVGEEMRHVLADILGRGMLRDPALAGRSITVSEIRVSPDMRNATAFVMPLGGEDATAIVTALNRASAFLRGEVSRHMMLRYMPALHFTVDTLFDEAQRIDSLFRNPAVARDLTGPGPADGEPGESDEAGDDGEADGA